MAEGNGTPLQYSCLENPMGGGAWWAAVHAVAQSRTWLQWLSRLYCYQAYVLCARKGRNTVPVGTSVSSSVKYEVTPADHWLSFIKLLVCVCAKLFLYKSSKASCFVWRCQLSLMTVWWHCFTPACVFLSWSWLPLFILSEHFYHLHLERRQLLVGSEWLLAQDLILLGEEL